MSKVEFHVHVPDKLAYSCRLLRKAYLKGARVAVTAEPEVLAELDHLLWSFSPAEFVPHCRAGASPVSLAASPIVLAKSLAACAHRDVLVNLGHRMPAGFEAFERVIEVVAQLDDDVAAGRNRWKHYKAGGHALTKHERTPSGGQA